MITLTKTHINKAFPETVMRKGDITVKTMIEAGSCMK